MPRSVSNADAFQELQRHVQKLDAQLQRVIARGRLEIGDQLEIGQTARNVTQICAYMRRAKAIFDAPTFEGSPCPTSTPA